jgi:CHASE2 domain-containing sensor protein
MPLTRHGQWHPVLYVRNHYRTIFGLAILPAIAFLAYSLNFLNTGGVANKVEQMYIAFVTHTTQKTLSRDIRLVYIDEDHNKDLLAHNSELAGFMSDEMRRQLWRKLHARLVSKLEGAGAAIIVFDFTFPPANSAAKTANRAFADAVRDVKGRGRTRIIIGSNPDESTDHDLGQAFSLAEQGNVDIGGAAADTGNRRLLRRIAIAISEGRTRNEGIEEHLAVPLPMPLLLLTLARQTGTRLITARLDAEQSEVTLYENGQPIQHIRSELTFCKAGARNCDVSEGFEWRRMALLPLVMPSIDPRKETPYENVLSAGNLADYKGKIVIIGARLPEEEVSVPESDSRVQLYGYQVHAAVLDDLLHDGYPRGLASVSRLLVFYAMAAFAFLGRRLLPRTDVKMNTYVFGDRLVPVGLLILIAIYVISSVILYSTSHLILNVAYDLILLVAAYFVFGPKLPAPAQQAS